MQNCWAELLWTKYSWELLFRRRSAAVEDYSHPIPQQHGPNNEAQGMPSKEAVQAMPLSARQLWLRNGERGTHPGESGPQGIAKINPFMQVSAD